MDPQELFINLRYVKDIKSGKQAYTSKTGTLKKVTLTAFTEKLFKEDQVWFKLSDFDEETQRNLSDMAISLDDLIATISNKSKAAIKKRKEDKDTLVDSEGVRILIDDDTKLLPIVGNLLPSDSTDAYTIKLVGGKPILDPILVCWGCHWSELFTGQTKYKNNVFCLASDLSEEQMDEFIGELITLKDAAESLGLDQQSKDKRM